jgi:broad specificity phosphatase PhoE
MPMTFIESYNTTQEKLILNEKIILNSEGEERAKILCNMSEFDNIDSVYTSNCVRTLQTAKYLLERLNLKVKIDDRLDERRAGKPNDKTVPDWFIKQYYEPEYKTEGGESQLDVRNRMEEVINEILEDNKDKRVAIFTHGYAITFYLLKYCKLIDIYDKKLKYEYNGKIFFDKTINAPEVFKLTCDENKNLENLELIEFKELPLNHGI